MPPSPHFVTLVAIAIIDALAFAPCSVGLHLHVEAFALPSRTSLLPSPQSLTGVHGHVWSSRQERPRCSRSRSRSFRRSLLAMSGAGELPTAYEWLARERGGPVSRIEWVGITCTLPNPADDDDDDDSDASDDGAADRRKERERPQGGDEDETIRRLQRVPVYPLGACYVPSHHINVHILNNVEPQNIRMALDLTATSTATEDEGQQCQWDGQRQFCVTLRAADTGRIAKIGTLMKVLETEEQRSHYDGSLLRVQVKCRAEGLVDIVQIENPECWSRESKLMRSDEYLVAKVRPMNACSTETATTTAAAFGEDVNLVAQRIADDYAAVRSMYTSKEGVAARELPPFAVDAVKNLPELYAPDFIRSEQSLWDAASVWQVLCNTVREARRSELQSEVNEITISAAMKKGGPLKLPVHRSDLPMEVQARLNRMEEDAARDFVALGMDPCLDFQALLSSRDPSVRLRHLASMISRERGRLEAKESLKELFMDDASMSMHGSGASIHNGTSAFQ